MRQLLSFLEHNWHLKVAALLLAIIIWTMVNRGIRPTNPALPEERTVLKQVPVCVLARADVQGEVILRPAEVDVIVKGAPEGIRQIKPADLKIYVDISGLRGRARDTRRVQWSVSASGVQVDSTSPRVVEVELR